MRDPARAAVRWWGRLASVRRREVEVAKTSKGAKRRRGTVYLVVVGAVAVAVVAVLVASRPFGGPLDWGIRGAALLAYLAIFLAAVASAFMRRLTMLLGRPFVRTHHVLSVAGLALASLHPLGVAVRSADLGVFLPNFSSLRLLLSLGGRPAWYLMGAAALAAVLRRRIKGSWRGIHVLNYVAFLLATAHAILIGTDFFSPVMKAVAAVMALGVAVVFVRKRVERSKVRRRK